MELGRPRLSLSAIRRKAIYRTNRWRDKLRNSWNCFEATDRSFHWVVSPLQRMTLFQKISTLPKAEEDFHLFAHGGMVRTLAKEILAQLRIEPQHVYAYDQ